jgi:signal peptidase I
MSTARIFTCAVEGRSMSPKLNAGDWIVAKRIENISDIEHNLVGKIVIAQVGELLQIKRVNKTQLENGEMMVWLLGENESESTDSRSYGWVKADSIIATYWFRFKKGRRPKKIARPIFKDGRFNI